MKEVFRQIDGYENHYMISNLGNVMSLKDKNFGLILKKQNNTHGYHHVLLCKDGKRKTKLIHQMVIDAFYPIVRKGSKLLVDHRDNDRKNNDIRNLRLVDFRENVLNRSDRHTFKSRYPGVTYESQNSINKWKARKQINGIRIYIGCFKTEEQARDAYISAEFAR